jgi:hypothetical protein
MSDGPSDELRRIVRINLAIKLAAARKFNMQKIPHWAKLFAGYACLQLVNCSEKFAVLIGQIILAHVADEGREGHIADHVLVVVAFASGGLCVGVLVVVEEEVAVGGGGLGGVDVADTGLVDDAASMITVLVDVAERPLWSMTT